jgi:hypothetical protein
VFGHTAAGGVVTYKKIACDGHDAPPTDEDVDRFVRACDGYWKEHPGSVVGVHCKSGRNRTGFMIVSYILRKGLVTMDVGDAVATFAAARSGGIDKQSYIDTLFELNAQKGTEATKVGRIVTNAVAGAGSRDHDAADADAAAGAMATAAASVSADGVAMETEADTAATATAPAGSSTSIAATVATSSEVDESDAAEGRGVFVIGGLGVAPAPPPVQGRVRRLCRELIHAGRVDLVAPIARKCVGGALKVCGRSA